MERLKTSDQPSLRLCVIGPRRWARLHQSPSDPSMCPLTAGACSNSPRQVELTSLCHGRSFLCQLVDVLRCQRFEDGARDVRNPRSREQTRAGCWLAR